MGDYSFGDFDFSGGEAASQPFDFSGGEFNPSMDWTAGMSPGNQDWMNSLGTGAGTFGMGLDYNPVEGGTASPPEAWAPWMAALRGGQQPQAAPQQGAGAMDWMKAGTQGLGALGNVLGLGVSGLGMANAVKAMQQGGQQQKQFERAQGTQQQAQQSIQQAQQATQQSRDQAAQQQQYAQQVAAPAIQAGSSLTQAGEQAMLGGPLPGQMEQMVQKWKNESRARIQQYLAKTGISDSTMAAQFESWIDQSEGAYRQQLAQSLLGGGYQGITTAMGPIGESGRMVGVGGQLAGQVGQLGAQSGALATQAGGMAAGQMGGTDQFLREANNSIALLTGAQRGR